MVWTGNRGEGQFYSSGLKKQGLPGKYCNWLHRCLKKRWVITESPGRWDRIGRSLIHWWRKIAGYRKERQCGKEIPGKRRRHRTGAVIGFSSTLAVCVTGSSVSSCFICWLWPLWHRSTQTFNRCGLPPPILPSRIRQGRRAICTTACCIPLPNITTTVRYCCSFPRI